MTHPQLVATRLVENRYPGCVAAFLAGSIIRGEGTPTSDLDLVIVTEEDSDAPYRCSERVGNWPVEFFVHTPASLQTFFHKDMAHRTPSLLQMCSEGLVIRQKNGQAQAIKEQCDTLLAAGPALLSDQETRAKRYQLSDLLEDLNGSDKREEIVYIAAELAQTAADLWLAHHRRWSGHGKWLHRALLKADPKTAQCLHEALEKLYAQTDKTALMDFAEAVLALVGGPLFDGFDSRLQD
ncbi:MAG: nucleotidyltransferase domain-containing protein [Candidatus Sericytochromatia bacterium]